MSSKDCGCEIPQLVVELFTKLLGILDLDCKSQSYSRKYLARKSGEKKRRKKGGAGARQRRFARRTGHEPAIPGRAETVGGTSTPPPPPPRSRTPPPAPPQRTTSLLRKGCGMLDKSPPKLPPKQDLGLVRRTLDPGQAPRRKTGKATEKQTTFQPKNQDSRMIRNATHFLDLASGIRNKEAENKIKLERMKSTPGPGFQKTQIIPFNQVFCFMCLKYVEKIHYCERIKMYINIDDKNLILLWGSSPDQVTGISGTKNCTVFERRKDMKNHLISLRNQVDVPCVVIDEVTNEHLEVTGFDLTDMGDLEKAMELARKKKAEKAELAKAKG